jgi:putative oxidoreductase
MLSNTQLPLALFLLHVAVFVVMVMWTIDKFVRPQHAAAVFQHFYTITGLNAPLAYLIGVLELVVIIGFVLGFQKRLTYGAVFLLHGASTLASFRQYLAPFEGTNLLFYAAWPMWAACFALYYLRDLDTLRVLDKHARQDLRARSRHRTISLE